MKYRALGGTGVRVSVIGVGTWQLGGEWGHAYTQAEVDAILDEAAAMGMNLIDTAECYGDHCSEALIGDYLARRRREDWVVATKFGHRYLGFNDRAWALSPAEVEEQLESSLRALRVDRVDVYQFHSGTDESFQQPALWAMLERQRRAGKVGHLGVSISSKAGPLQAELARAVGAEMLQVVYNRLERRAERDFLPAARRDGLGVLARVPLASGFLSGKYTGPGSFPGTDVRSTYDPVAVARWAKEAAEIQRTEVPDGVTMSAWALAWCLRHATVTSVIPGCRTPAQVRLNAQAADLVATEAPRSAAD
jgi:aryl-alcohol dehydrogenase-like predicted oxidoreductase